MIAYFRRCVAVLLIVSLLLPFTAHAARFATEAALDHQRIGQLLERADVQRELRARGVDLAQARERAAALTDAEAAQIVSNIDQLPAGGVGYRRDPDRVPRPVAHRHPRLHQGVPVHQADALINSALFSGESMKPLVVILGLLAAFPVLASEELAKKHACFACHAVDKKLVGPSYKDVAAKYRADKDGAEAKLADKVKKGGQGVWGQVPMPPNAQVPDADIHTLVKWILSQK